MYRQGPLKTLLTSSACAATLLSAANAMEINVSGGDLESALNQYSAQTGVPLAVSYEAIKSLKTKGASGDLSADAALSRILKGTGLISRRDAAGVIQIVPGASSSIDDITPMQLAQAAPPPRAAVETVTVTSSKLGGADVQSIPISITALSQEQLTATQTAGGPDLVKQVPNLTFTKTNFTGYSIQIRGIGTQAVSVTTDPAVAVALNDIPFIRNHFFEQEFYDLGQAEVLRGPQGTLYGRNATAGVINLVTAKPTDQFEAMASGEIGNYHQRRFEGMINLPILDDRLDIRVAGEWTKRQGYSFNELTNQRIDGRDLWSGRVSIAWKPLSNLQTYLVWEHFYENDDRMRTAKQLCKNDPIPLEVGGTIVPGPAGFQAYSDGNYLSQGCQPASLYADESFQVPNGRSLPYYEPLEVVGAPIRAHGGSSFDVFANTEQSRNLRVIETQLDPVYKAKNDVIELNTDYSVTPDLAASSQTGFSQDFLWSTEDYNRFNTSPGAFLYPDTYGIPSGHTSRQRTIPDPAAGTNGIPLDSGIFCDPQLGCSDRLVAQDLSEEHAWQLSQEIRLTSHFEGPFNFSVGGNYLHYETEENYYVFVNALTLASYGWGQANFCQQEPWVPGVSDNSNCLFGGFANTNPKSPSIVATGAQGNNFYIDPNPITSLDNKGHNYFLSQNPYVLNSYALFGETYYDITPDLKLTAGLRWTEDKKHFIDIPSELLIQGYGYPIFGVVDQDWDQFTGRFAVNWTPKLDFTDQTLVYTSYARGYKAGGANPPGARLGTIRDFGTGGTIGVTNPIHPLTFEPEFINAFELGTKNTLLDGELTFNGSAFFYLYKNYQISRIVDRTAINDNFDATVRGAEIEATYEPLPGLRLNFSGGYENTRIADGESAVDLIDRTDSANHPDWVVVKPFVSQASNCILPTYVVAYIMSHRPNGEFGSASVNSACLNAYQSHVDPGTDQTYTAGPTADYAGFDPLTAPNNGEGFAKDLGGNELPNAPPFTVSAGAQYTIPVLPDWTGTFRADYYWQDYSWARVFNDRPYDRLRGYTNVNLSLIFTGQSGWQVMLYDKNVFNTTDVTGAFLNSDDSGLTTNVFLTDPKLIGVRVTKNW